MRLLALMTVLFALSLHTSSSYAIETEGASSSREKEILAMQLELSRIAGMKSVVDHLAKKSLECETVADCVSMPMGSRACGGPTSFVVTSKVNPSLEAVSTSVAMVTKAEKDANMKFHLVSICSIEMAPALDCAKSTCVGAN